MFMASVARFSPVARNVSFRGLRTYTRATCAELNGNQFSNAWSTNSACTLAPLHVSLPRLVTEDIVSAARFAAAQAAAIGSCSFCSIDDP